MAQQQNHPIFLDIKRGDLQSVRQRVLADATVLGEQQITVPQRTPLMHAIICDKLAIALWLFQQRAQHDLERANEWGNTALHYASQHGPLEVVQALVAAGANTAALTSWSSTSLIIASADGHTNFVAFPLQLPAVKARIDQVDRDHDTGQSLASFYGHHPTVPPSPRSPLNQAIDNNHNAIAALLRRVIDETDRARALHKARFLLGRGAAALACLQGRVEQGQALPQVELTQQQRQQYEKLRATAAFAVGVSGGEKVSGLCEELYVELLGYMLPAWADKGPGA